MASLDLDHTDDGCSLLLLDCFSITDLKIAFEISNGKFVTVQLRIEVSI